MVLLIGESTVHTVWNYSACWQLPFCAFCLVAQPHDCVGGFLHQRCNRNPRMAQGTASNIWQPLTFTTSFRSETTSYPGLAQKFKFLLTSVMIKASPAGATASPWYSYLLVNLLVTNLPLRSNQLAETAFYRKGKERKKQTNNNKKTVLHEMNRQWYCRAVPAWVPQAENLTEVPVGFHWHCSLIRAHV